MLNASNLRISVAFLLSVCVHIALMGLDLTWMSGRDLTAAKTRRVTITFAPRRIEAVSPPSALPGNTSRKRRVAAAMIVPAPQKTVDVLVREIPRPIKQAEETKQETGRNAEEVLKTTIQPALPAQTKKTAAIDLEPATATVKEARPLYRNNPSPFYPSLARRRGYQGTVLLEVLVDKQGRASDLRVSQSSGYKVLDRAAENAVRSWQFEPGMKGNKKMDMWVRVPIRFQLR